MSTDPLTRSLPGLLLSLAWGCAANGPVAPVILYPGPARNPTEIAVVQVARTPEARGAPTLNIRRITRLEPDPGVLYRVEAGVAWSPPGHFGGLQGTQNPRQTGDPTTLPDRFELPPGTYRVEFLYVPLVGRWGETHKPQDGSSVQLECAAGRTYVLKGSLDPDGHRFFLTSTVLVGGDG